MLRCRFGDHCQGRAALAFGLGESAPAHDGDAEQRKERWRDAVELDELRALEAIEFDAAAKARSLEWHDHRLAGRVHARDGGNSFHQLAVELKSASVAVALLLQIEPDGCDALHRKSWIKRLRRLQAPRQQPGG